MRRLEEFPRSRGVATAEVSRGDIGEETLAGDGDVERVAEARSLARRAAIDSLRSSAGRIRRSRLAGAVRPFELSATRFGTVTPAEFSRSSATGARMPLVLVSDASARSRAGLSASEADSLAEPVGLDAACILFSRAVWRGAYRIDFRSLSTRSTGGIAVARP